MDRNRGASQREGRLQVKLPAVRSHESQGLAAPHIQERIKNGASEAGTGRGCLFGEAFKKVAT